MRSGLPLVFGPDERPLTGFFHPPSEPRSSLAVVLCNALGFEEASAHRTYRHLAEHLSAAGIGTLRFDYDGAGNSPTPSDAPSRMPAWLSSLGSAAAEARRLTGAPRLALIGLRFGASLAALAASKLDGLDALVLWAPIVSGRAHVRDLRAFAKLKGLRAARTDGAEEIGGYFHARETLDAMAAVDLLALPRAGAPRVLLLSRGSSVAAEQALAQHLEASRVQVSMVPDEGYGRMMRDDPYEAVVPIATLDAIVAWLAAEPPSAGETPPPARVGNSADAGRPVHIGPLRETLVRFGDQSRLFGIATEPELPSAQRRAVCFVNVGANHLAAPHRINVELAREVAALGFLAFRFDLSGLGDSGCAPGTAENRLYTLEAVADVQQAMRYLAAAHGARDFVVVGLCSGAYVAFHSAVREPRVMGQVLLSPYAFEWKTGDPVTPAGRAEAQAPQAFEAFHSTRFYLRALFEPRTWLRLSRGEINVRAIATALSRRGRARAAEALDSAVDRLGLPERAASDVEQAFKSLSNRGVETLVVAGFQDGGVDLVSKYLGTDARKMRGRSNFTLEILEGVDHTFTTVDSRQRLLGVLKRFLARQPTAKATAS